MSEAVLNVPEGMELVSTSTAVEEAPVENPAVEAPVKPKRKRKAKAKAETKPKAKAKAKAKPKVEEPEKKGRGRPPFGDKIRKRVLSCITKHGLTNGLAKLEEAGLKVSMTLAIAVAKENKLTFEHGRPKLPAATRKTILSYIKKHGLTHGLRLLEEEKGVKASMTLASAVAKENKLTFPKGRPAQAA